jgi:hypothetical protein
MSFVGRWIRGLLAFSSWELLLVLCIAHTLICFIEVVLQHLARIALQGEAGL